MTFFDLGISRLYAREILNLGPNPWTVLMNDQYLLKDQSDQ